MSSKNRLSLAVLALFAAAPLASLACGGSTPPAESPAEESSASAAPAGTEAAPGGGETAASAAPAAEAPSAAPAETASAAPAPAAPAAPSIASTDCGKCIDKACTKQQAACAKDTDCGAMVDSFHNCSSDKGVASCLDSATPPTAAKPKKLATAYDACVKKAAASKACKASCK